MRNKTILLYLITILILLSACGGSAAVTTADTTAATTVASTQTLTEPSTNLLGYTFTLAAPWAGELLPAADESELGDTVLALYKQIEDKYNAVFRIEQSNGLDDYIAMSEAGICADVVGLTTHEWLTLARMGYMLPLDEPKLIVAGLDPSDSSCFFRPLSRLFPYKDRQWTLQVASAITLPRLGSFILTNNRLLGQVGGNGIYNLVVTNQWDYDNYLQLSEQIDGLNVRGRARTVWTAGGYISGKITYSNGGGTISTDGDTYQSRLGEPQSAEALKFLKTSFVGGRRNGYDDAVTAFVEGKLAFLWTDSRIFTDGNALAGIKDSFGVVPLPVGPDHDRYVSVLGQQRSYGFLSSVHEHINSVTLFNAWARRLTTLGWQTELGATHRFDSASIAMLRNYILPNSVLDHSELIGELTAQIDGLAADIASGGTTAEKAADRLEDILAAQDEQSADE